MFDTPPLTELAVSAVAGGGVAAIGLLARETPRDLLMLWGATTGILMVALNDAPSGLLIAVLIVVTARIVVDRQQRLIVLGLGLAWLVWTQSKDLDPALRAVTPLVVAGAAPLVSVTYRRMGPVASTILIVGTSLGIYINVPDTEQIVLIAPGLAVVGAAMMVFARLRRSPAWFGSIALAAALVVTAGSVGARGRPAAFFGVVGALAVLIAEPLAGLIRRNTQPIPLIAIAIHAPAVFVASRIAGVREADEAVPIVLAVLGATLVLLVILPRRPIPPG